VGPLSYEFGLPGRKAFLEARLFPRPVRQNLLDLQLVGLTRLPLAGVVGADAGPEHLTGSLFRQPSTFQAGFRSPLLD
jgi:hypothetical protein